MIRSYECDLLQNGGKVTVTHYRLTNTVVMSVGGDLFLAPRASNITALLNDTNPARMASELARCMGVQRTDGSSIRVTLSRNYVSDDTMWGPFGGWSTWNPGLLECHVIPRGFTDPIAKLEAVWHRDGHYVIHAYSFVSGGEVEGPVFRTDTKTVDEACREAERAFSRYLIGASQFDVP